MRFIFNGDLEIQLDYFNENLIENVLFAARDIKVEEGFEAPDLEAFVGMTEFDSLVVSADFADINLQGNYSVVRSLTTTYNNDNNIFSVSLVLE